VPDGKQVTKTFAALKFGERAAFELAVEARQTLLESVKDETFIHHQLAKQFAPRKASDA
jgi:hypothetical protein